MKKKTFSKVKNGELGNANQHDQKHKSKSKIRHLELCLTFFVNASMFRLLKEKDCFFVICFS